MASSIEFKLFAPYNEKATISGSFKDWEEIPMTKTEDGYFRTTIELEDGIYQYKFRLQSKSWFLEPNQWVYISDPYATEIDNATQNTVIRIKEGKRIVDDYIWQDHDQLLPNNDELIIYELFVSGFSGGEGDGKKRGNFQDLIEKLDYLCELGINAIELLPVQEYPGDDNWGYTPRYFFAIESSYGKSEDLKCLIDECHSRGIRVIMDSILNHSDADSPLTQIDYDYWFHHSARDPDNSWGPEFNYEHYDENLDVKPAWQFSGDAVHFWVEEYRIDGIRYDAARQIANYDFMSWIAEQAKKAASMKPFFNIAEHIPETPDLVGFDRPMDSCWHESFYQQVLKHICGDHFDLEALKEVLDCRRQGYPDGSNVINYLTNHDRKYPMADLGDRGIFEAEAFKRAKLGAVLLMTTPGIPMIWMGSEFGEFQLQREAKIDWTLLANELNQNLFDYYKGLIALRKSNHALRTSNIDFFWEDSENKVLAYNRWNDEGSRVVVVTNFSDNFLEDYQLPRFPATGTWHEWTTNYDLEAEEAGLKLNLGGYEAQVFVK
ncbi:putative alpha-glucanotransferase [Stanieria sp. NIES-3757]|nr:putative alpha-glucanotransferase [Stanieria sp. NIES-3757]